LLDYLPQKGDDTMCVLRTETRAALANIESNCQAAVAQLERTILAGGFPLGGAAEQRMAGYGAGAAEALSSITALHQRRQSLRLITVDFF
jgi:hypothetical protein